MSNQLRHLTNIHQAADELHKRLLGLPNYIRCQVFTHSPERKAAVDKHEWKEIVIFVKDPQDAGNSMTQFNSWPVRYEQGV